MSSRRDAIRSYATSPLLPAACFFFFGWVQSVDTDSSMSNIYNFTVLLANWTMRVGCIVYLAIAAGLYQGMIAALAADAIVTAFCAVVLIAVGADWATYGFVNGYLFVIFGIMFATSAKSTFVTWQRMRSIATDAPMVAPPAPVHPASVHPEVLPSQSEPPPAEGYLAALAREKKSAPRADHE